MTFEMNKDKVVEAPKDTILDGVVIDIEKTTWRVIVPAEKLEKFAEPDQEVLKIKYEYKFKESVLGGSDTVKYYANPSEHSKLGKFLTKYDNLKVGSPIKIDINGEGFSNIRIK